MLIAPDIKAPAVKIGAASKLQIGDRVYSIGSPEGLELSLGDGIIAQLRSSAQYPIQTTAPISHGSSGGGLFDEKGQLVGITSAGSETGANIGFAVPVEWIRELRQQKYLALRGSVSSVNEVAEQSEKSVAEDKHDWVLADSTAEGDLYYDKNLLMNKDGIVALFEAANFKKTQKVEQTIYKSVRSVVIYDCNIKKISFMTVEFYSDNLLKGKLVNTVKEDKPIFEESTSPWDKKMLEIVCGSEQEAVAPHPAAENISDWEVVAKGEDGSLHYIKKSTMKVENGLVTVNRLQDFDKKQYDQVKKAYYKSLITAEDYDCKAKTLTLYGEIKYSENMVKGDIVSTFDKQTVVKITPGTVGEITLDYVCGNKTSQAAPPAAAAKSNAKTYNWQKVYTYAGDTTGYIDKDKTVNKNGKGYTITLDDYPKSRTFQDIQGEFKSMLAIVGFDCKVSKSATYHFQAVYTGNMGNGKEVVFLDAESPPVPIEFVGDDINSFKTVLYEVCTNQ